MKKKFKIAIAGIGGVGGYYGGKLASFYYGSPNVEVSFIARDEHLSAIKEKGLTVTTDGGTFVARPFKVVADPSELGELDLILFCCKAYSLTNFARLFYSNISERTFLIPLLNGVDAAEKLMELYPQAKCLYGCTYIISKIVSPGVISRMGNLSQILFGNPKFSNDNLSAILDAFTHAGISASLHGDIKIKLWEKYSFISPIAIITTATNSCIGKIRESDSSRTLLFDLMSELLIVATKEGIELSTNIIDRNFDKIEKLPYEMTSSMHFDFVNKNEMEIGTLGEFVLNRASVHGVSVPTYQQLLQQIIGKQ